MAHLVFFFHINILYAWLRDDRFVVLAVHET